MMLASGITVVALLATAHAYPSKFSGKLWDYKPGADFNKMGIAKFESSYSDKCEIGHNVPADGWSAGSTYQFNVTTSESTGLGFKYVMRYQKQKANEEGNSPDNKKPQAQLWQAPIATDGGDYFAIYAICGSKNGGKMYVAEPVLLCKKGAECPDDTPSPEPEPELESPSSGAGRSVQTVVASIVVLMASCYLH